MHIKDCFIILSVTLLTLHRVQKSRAANNPATYPCPDRNGSTYAGANGSSYHIECSTDYAGNDLPAVHTDTFGECLDACDAYVPGSSAEAHDFASCIGVSWGAGNPSANCYLKYQITSVNPNDVGFSSGYQANYTPPESGATTSGSSPSPTTTSAASATHAAASTTQPSPTSSSHSDSHGAISVGAGIGIGIGAAIGIAIVAGTVYFCRRRHRRRRPGRLEAPLELSAEVLADRKFDRLRKPSAEGWVDELPAECQPVELHGQRGPRAELFEIRGTRPEIG
ncbi:hypothetical protein BDR22DRAFT_965153 [Usnea florida]